MTYSLFELLKVNLKIYKQKSMTMCGKMLIMSIGVIIL